MESQAMSLSSRLHAQTTSCELHIRDTAVYCVCVWLMAIWWRRPRAWTREQQTSHSCASRERRRQFDRTSRSQRPPLASTIPFVRSDASKEGERDGPVSAWWSVYFGRQQRAGPVAVETVAVCGEGRELFSDGQMFALDSLTNQSTSKSSAAISFISIVSLPNRIAGVIHEVSSSHR